MNSVLDFFKVLGGMVYRNLKYCIVLAVALKISVWIAIILIFWLVVFNFEDE